jgi:hypothetical protein
MLVFKAGNCYCNDPLTKRRICRSALSKRIAVITATHFKNIHLHTAFLD